MRTRNVRKMVENINISMSIRVNKIHVLVRTCTFSCTCTCTCIHVTCACSRQWPLSDYDNVFISVASRQLSIAVKNDKMLVYLPHHRISKISALNQMCARTSIE